MTTQTLSHISPLRYPGGKTRAIRVLDGLLPKTPISRAVSPFTGGGSFELHLTKLGVRVDGFDAYRPLVNFWTELLTNPELLATEVARNMPVDKSAFKRFQSALSEQPTDGVASAAAFLIVNRCSFSGSTMSGGFSSNAAENRLTQSIVQRLATFANPLLSVSESDFSDSLTVDTDFVFADPPYLLPEKQSNKLYGNQGHLHNDFDHERFATAITALTVPWMVTYNDSPEVRRLFVGHAITPVQWSYGMNASKRSSEIVIRNY